MKPTILKTIQYLAVRDDKNEIVRLPLEFEGRRAFAIWDTVRVGHLELKARIEVNPRLLRKSRGAGFRYSGKLVLPVPAQN